MAFQGDSIYWVEVEKVVPNPFQPRRDFDQNKLQELADSIRMYGVLQPLTVTRKEVQREDGTFYSEYELIAGERRLRASKLAGVAQVPVIIREGEQSEQEKLELAIIENLQREDLNAVDRAIAFKQLTEQFGLSHAQVAQKMGRSREYVSNSIRLLALPDNILESLKCGNIMEGHARTLLMLNDRSEEQGVVHKEIMLKKLSVREVERIVRKIATDKVRKKTLESFDTGLIELEKKFTETLGTRVQIQKTDFGGKLTIDYFSEDDLESILRRIKDEVTEQNNQSSANKISEHTPIELTEESLPEQEFEPVSFANFVDRPETVKAIEEIAEKPQSSPWQVEESVQPLDEVITEPTSHKVENETDLPIDQVVVEPRSEELIPKREEEVVETPANQNISESRLAESQIPHVSRDFTPNTVNLYGFNKQNGVSISAMEEVEVRQVVHEETNLLENNSIQVSEPSLPIVLENKSEINSSLDETSDDSALYSINKFTI